MPEDAAPEWGQSTLRSRKAGAGSQASGTERRISVHPYIEAWQVVQGAFNTPHDVLTYLRWPRAAM
jgi:hypothetical protein